MKKKRKPMRQQIEDAKSETTDESIYQGLATFMLVLIDKEDAGIEQIRRIWEAVQVLADKVKDNGAMLLDMVDKLDKECGIKIDPVYIRRAAEDAGIAIGTFFRQSCWQSGGRCTCRRRCFDGDARRGAMDPAGAETPPGSHGFLYRGGESGVYQNAGYSGHPAG